MKNVTVTLDEETARWARVEAAHRDMSLSRLISQLLHEYMRSQTTYDDAMRRYLARAPTALKGTGRYPSREGCTTVPVFVDTNVLVHARDASEPEKQPQAAWIEHLWRTRTARLSFQVLQEYYATTTRKRKPGLTPSRPAPTSAPAGLATGASRRRPARSRLGTGGSLRSVLLGCAHRGRGQDRRVRVPVGRRPSARS